MVAAFQRSDRAESSTSSSSSRSIVEYCQQCLTWSNGLERNRLEPDGYGHVACIVCGAIDETSSTRVNHKDEHAIMGSIMDDPGPVSGKHELEKYTCWEDHTFRVSFRSFGRFSLMYPDISGERTANIPRQPDDLYPRLPSSASRQRHSCMVSAYP